MSITKDDLYIFANLDDGTMEAIRQISHKIELDKEAVLFFEKDKPKYLHILLKGGLRLYKTTPKGQEIVLHDIYAPSLVAEFANFNAVPYPATAKALSKCEVVKIDFGQFYEKFISNPTLSMLIIKSLLEKLKIVEGFIDKEFTKSAEAKVATLLLENLAFFESSKQLNIAKLLNITPETLSRILTRFKNDGLIAANGKKINILDSDTLSRICENEWV